MERLITDFFAFLKFSNAIVEIFTLGGQLGTHIKFQPFLTLPWHFLVS